MEREREREREGDRQTDRQTERKRDRQTDRQTEIETETERHTGRQTDNIIQIWLQCVILVCFYYNGMWILKKVSRLFLFIFAADPISDSRLGLEAILATAYI